MITFQTVNQADFNAVSVLCTGDDSSIVLKMNLSKPPFNINYQGKLPDGFKIDVGQEGVTATASIATTPDGDVITVTFSSAIPSDEITNINCASSWNSVA